MNIPVLYIEHEEWWHENEFRTLTITYPHDMVPADKRQYYLKKRQKASEGSDLRIT